MGDFDNSGHVLRVSELIFCYVYMKKYLCILHQVYV